MPLYEYTCPLCEHRLEVLQRLDADAPWCPRCGRPGNGLGPEGVLVPVMVKQISRTNFALKGAGWYKDHYGLKTASKD